MITTTRTEHLRVLDPGAGSAAGQNFKIPTQRHQRLVGVPISPDHITDEARRRSEAEQSAIDIAAGW